MPCETEMLRRAVIEAAEHLLKIELNELEPMRVRCDLVDQLLATQEDLARMQGLDVPLLARRPVRKTWYQRLLGTQL